MMISFPSSIFPNLVNYLCQNTADRLVETRTYLQYLSPRTSALSNHSLANTASAAKLYTMWKSIAVTVATVRHIVTFFRNVVFCFTCPRVCLHAGTALLSSSSASPSDLHCLCCFRERDPSCCAGMGPSSLKMLMSPVGSLMQDPGTQSQPRLPRVCVILCAGPDTRRHPTESPDSHNQSCRGRSTQAC